MALLPLSRAYRRHSNRFWHLAASLLLVAGAVVVRAERLPVRTYTIADGLVRDGAARIFQDSRGFLWFCTADGASRFDGYGFTNFTTDDGLPERHVNDVIESNDTLFFATGGGLARLNPTGIRGSVDRPLFTVLSPELNKPVAFESLLKESDDVILAGTNVGLYRLEIHGDNVKFEAVPLDGTADHPEVTAVFRDSKGVLWAGQYGRVVRISPDEQPVVFNKENGVPTAGITKFSEDGNGNLWVGMRDFGGLLLLARDAAPGESIIQHVFRSDDGLPTDWVSDILITRDGTMWLGMAHGLCQWEPKVDAKAGFACRRVYRGENGLCDSGVDGLLEDKDGNMWSTGGCGTQRIARYGFTTFDKADGLGFPFPETLLLNNSGELIATGRPGPRTLSRFTGENFELAKLRDLPTVTGYGWGWQQTVMQDHVGDWWTATANSLLRYRDPGRFSRLSSVTPEKMNEGAWSGEPFRIYEDSRGDVWVATPGPPRYSLFRWDRSTGKWHDHTVEAGLTPVSLVSFFIEDRSGNLWIATGIDNGREALLIRYRDGRFTSFTEADGVPPGWMRDVHMDSQGRLWFANTSVGLLQLVDPNAEGRLEFVRYGRGQGLSSNGIYCVVDDSMGRIYAGSGRGIDRLDPNTGTVENFTTSDGLPSNGVEVAHKDRNGDLWFSTGLGLARLRPEPVRPREAPRALVIGVHTPAGPKPISILGEAEVPTIDLVAHEGAIRIDFVGLGAALGEKLRYAYRLGDGSWNSTAERSVNIADLGAGDFVLEVRAITTDNLVSPPATVAFRVAPPFWQTGWFLALAASLAALFVFVLVQNRIRRLVELERIRTRIATDLHDDIGANLTRIAMLSEVASRQSENGGQSLLPSIANIARESVESMNDIVWAISPDHDRLLDLIRRMRTHAEDVFTFRDIELAFSAPDAETDLHLSVGVRRDLLLVFKEAVNNAARHSGCTRVEIDLRIEHNRLTLVVADNGKGFNSNNGHDGQGLRSMRRRAETLAGRLGIRSKNGGGTTVTFEIPLHRPAANKPSNNHARS